MTEKQKEFVKQTPDQEYPDALADPVKPNIFQRLNLIRREVEYLKKDATVTGYKAITHDFVTSAIRQHLITHGVLTIPRQIEGELRDTGKTTKGGVPFTAYIGMYEFDFVNEDDPGDMVTVRVGAISEDTADKGPGGAISYAMKYAFLKVFNIETGESEESRHDQKPEYISTDQALEINDMITETDTNMVSFLKVAKAKDVANILQSAYPMLKKQLEKKKEKLRQPGE
ncbi:MAG: hypothetical protein BBJ57_02390 [Desulfobacterales bacterium PC51MH44]|nr:MAG: hypothetical protein BBJ57_02390 [Desulfobacterales bacterium PC51MH44]